MSTTREKALSSVTESKATGHTLEEGLEEMLSYLLVKGERTRATTKSLIPTSDGHHGTQDQVRSKFMGQVAVLLHDFHAESIRRDPGV